jgi:hypothetical protein
MGTNWEGGLVIGDVTGDGQEDVVYGGGGSDRIYVLSGTDGSTIAYYSNTAIGTYCQPQLYDVDGNGVLDILVPLYYPPGLAAVKYSGGSLQLLWSRTIETAQPGGTGTLGSVMAKPVAGDIDGDGDLDIFLASQDVSPATNTSGNYRWNGYTGSIVRLDHLGNIVARSFSWRACSGGLSLADTDNDGVFEVYQGDRDMDYSDGGYGKGEKSYWAEDLAERWIRLDDLTSSQAPVIADVNGDGIKDIITGMYSQAWVFNSTNGEAIYHWSNNDLSDHYLITVYDIDGDGHLEVLCNDGDHDDEPYTDVFDLVTGEMDAQLYHFGQVVCDNPDYLEGNEFNHLLGTSKWSPLVADIDPTHDGMEIISVPEGTGLDGGYWWNGAILIWSSSYESLQNITRRPGSTPGTYGTLLGSQLGYPFVQDIDGDDLLELVTHSSSGHVYAYDSIAPAPGYNQAQLPGSKRVRSEVTGFGEGRMNAAEHTIMPWEEDYWTAPLVAPVSPSDNSLAVPVSTTQLSFKLREHQSESLTYSVTTSPDIGSTNGLVSSGTYNWNTRTVTVSGLAYDTTYRWTVSASDGSNVTPRTYTFRTELAPNADNTAPGQGVPALFPLDGIGSTTSIFQAANQSTFDINGDPVTNIYRWTVNGDPVTRLLLPFDTRDETSTKDYSGFGNDGEVIGATWVPNGIVGGAYSFDGKDDAIVISDGGLGYYNDREYSSNNEELGGFGNWNELTVEAWIYLTKYNNGSRIVAKVPSYALGFSSGSTSRIYGAVWPYSGEINADDDNHATTDRMQQVQANVNIQLNTWYHIAFTYENGTGLKLYFNGQLVAQGSTRLGPLSESRGEPLYIGRLVQPFAGMIDEVRLHNYAQPAEQIYNRYMESKDGNSSSSLFIPTGIAAPGDTLGVQVIPTDSFHDGSPMANSTVLLNSPPIASELNILPLRSRALRLDGENLVADYVYTDADGDLELDTEIRWYKNSVLQADLNDTLQVSASSTTAGDVWYFTVRPGDSRGGYGEVQTSYNVTIRANTAPTHDTPQLVSSWETNYDDEDLIASAVNAFDVDGDEVSSIYHWIRDGASFANLIMPFDSENFTIAEDYSGYGNDGAVTGATWTQDGVVGGAYAFDGSDRIMVSEQGASLGGDGSWSTVSVEFWVKATVNTGSERLIWLHNASDTGDVGYRLEFRAYDDRNYVRWRVYYFNASDPLEDYYYSVEYNIYGGPRDWHHVVANYESGVGLKIFVDGTQRAFAPGTGVINAVGSGVLEIGYQSGSGDFMGVLDEVRIYEDALSSAQVFQRFIETKDGVSSSSTVVAQEIKPLEAWKCEVIPNDSFIDGTAKNSSTINVLVAPADGRPRIDTYEPTDLTPEVDEGSFFNFNHTSSDPDGPEAIFYAWLLDHAQVATTQNWTYTPSFGDAGVHNVTLMIWDQHWPDLFDSQQWSVTVNDVNLAPVIDTFFPATDPVIFEGAFQEFNVTYHDLDLDPLTVQWYLNGTPTVTVDSYTFVADYYSAGAYNVTVVVFDGLVEASHEWTLTVLEANGPPSIDYFAPEDTTPEVYEGASLEFAHVSSDPDDDLLSYSWLLDDVEQSAAQNWTYLPNYYASGLHNVTLVVSDGSLVALQQWEVTVVDVNGPPAMDSFYPLSDPTINEPELQEFNVTYSDPDGDPVLVQWFLNGTPTTTEGFYIFTSDYDSAGVYNVTVVLSAGFGQASHQWILTVLDTNRLPSIDWFVPENTTPEVDEDSSLVFEHISSDPDDDALFYSWLLDDFEVATSQNWTYWPDFEASGVHNVTLVVSDGDLLVSQQWSVTVVNVNRAPIIDWYYPLGDPVICEGGSEEFYVACYDPDGGLLSYQWYLDGTPTVTTDDYEFLAGYDSAGVYNVTVVISDGVDPMTHQWTLTVIILGDVDRDGDVDAFDLSDLGEAYGSTPALPNWNVSCDFDSNDLVDVLDLFSLGKNYGRIVSSQGLSQTFLNLATSATGSERLQALPEMLLLGTGYLMTVRTAECSEGLEKKRKQKPAQLTTP